MYKRNIEARVCAHPWRKKQEVCFISVMTASICATPCLWRYTFRGTNLFSVSHAFFCLAYYDIPMSIYFEYNDIVIHRFQYNFPRSRLFWECNPLLLLEKAVPLYKWKAWKMTIVIVINFVCNVTLCFSTPALNSKLVMR